MKHQITVVAALYFITGGNAALADQTLGAMEAFKDFCLTGTPSIAAMSEVAQARHYKLVIDRRLPGPGRVIIVNKMWQVTDVTGDFTLTVSENENGVPSRRLQCGVTLPIGTEKGVETELQAPSHFGVADQIKADVNGGREVRWERQYDWGTATISLASKLKQLHGASMINIVYQTKP